MPNLTGCTFAVPSPLTMVAPDQRLAIAVFTDAAVGFGQDLVAFSLAPGAMDLSLVQTGRCPLLAEHYHRLEALLGQVVAVEVDGPVARALVRFARGPEADRLWELMVAGFPLSLSIGATIQHAEKAGAGYRAMRWKLTEISVVVFGRDELAHLRPLGRGEDAAALVARMTASRGGAERAAVHAALHLDRWERWANLAAVRLAEELGVDLHRLGEALAREVAAHGELLLSDLAAPTAKVAA